ncbi:uncharacterized protein EI90DRAFT_3017874 [Cantharellus anzutake]|uniref:uncharacterized protein n=1 Tax=Cantharellus anzutake TaxID=1750568 RepID=UPI001903D77E|nr:uncharacterized protein EI90DRAFT_3017874 [Cantharellus anzutake]KAF8328255.1 hypothetical protein EI90DRAFT_3017874 [Cantharellus anzutake]
MYAKASTIDGNIEAIASLLEQSRIIKDAIFENYVVLVHGDLGVIEKIETIMRSRRIEEDWYERLGFLLPIPGLFHIRMACVDAINRIHGSTPGMRNDPNGLYKYLMTLFPNNTAKLNQKVPPFRMMNDGIDYILRVAILNAWKEDMGGDIAGFLKSNPTLDDIKHHAQSIASKQFQASHLHERHRHDMEQDQVRNNQVLFNCDAMYYRILVHAINYGMVDIILDVLAVWIPILLSCGKHKYASYLAKFLARVKQYPEAL